MNPYWLQLRMRLISNNEINDVGLQGILQLHMYIWKDLPVMHGVNRLRHICAGRYRPCLVEYIQVRKSGR